MSMLDNVDPHRGPIRLAKVNLFVGRPEALAIGMRELFTHHVKRYMAREIIGVGHDSYWAELPEFWARVFRNYGHPDQMPFFGTTQSLDCVKGFACVWAKNLPLGTFHRIEQFGPELVEAVEYDLETLQDSIDTNVEVR